MGGNESVPTYKVVSKKFPTILYRIQIELGDLSSLELDESLPHIEGHDISIPIKSGKNAVNIELLLNCKDGDIGPMPVNNLGANENRMIEMWHKDLGNPIYCILVFYREQNQRFPEIQKIKCEVQLHRKESKEIIRFLHGKTSGGDAVVYSMTLGKKDHESEMVFH